MGKYQTINHVKNLSGRWNDVYEIWKLKAISKGNDLYKSFHYSGLLLNEKHILNDIGMGQIEDLFLL